MPNARGHCAKLVRSLVCDAASAQGPMYAKYNAVLRARSPVPRLKEICLELTKGNNYVVRGYSDR